MDQLRSPEADVLVEKVQKLLSTIDHGQKEVHDALRFLDPSEHDRVASGLKSTLQIGLITRLCHMTIGGMGMDDAQVNAIALDLLQELQGLGRDLQKDAAAADKVAKSKGH